MTEYKITLACGTTKVLHTAGMYCDRDIVVTADGGGKREGTAIPAGEFVERIYFNLGNTEDETNALLSQLTYVETDLLPGMPVCAIFARLNPSGNGYEGEFIFAVKSPEHYGIYYSTDVSQSMFSGLYHSNFSGISNGLNGWNEVRFEEGYTIFNGHPNSITLNGASEADLFGLPVGAENEKIKNVLSVTPFY